MEREIARGTESQIILGNLKDREVSLFDSIEA